MDKDGKNIEVERYVRELAKEGWTVVGFIDGERSKDEVNKCHKEDLKQLEGE